MEKHTNGTHCALDKELPQIRHQEQLKPVEKQGGEHSHVSPSTLPGLSFECLSAVSFGGLVLNILHFF